MTLQALPRLWQEWDGRESQDCPAVRHRHSRDGYRIDGCRCPSTEVAYRRYMDLRNARRRAAREGREIDDCPAVRHRHSRRGYLEDGCRCPSTVTAIEAYRQDQRRRRQARRPSLGDNGRPLDLALADALDAEAIVQGYRLGARVDKHTRALAVLMMLRAGDRVTDRQMAWRMTNAGQGRRVAREGRAPEYEPVSVRQVQRMVAELVALPECADIKAMNRSGRARDDE